MKKLLKTLLILTVGSVALFLFIKFLLPTVLSILKIVIALVFYGFLFMMIIGFLSSGHKSSGSRSGNHHGSIDSHTYTHDSTDYSSYDPLDNASYDSYSSDPFYESNYTSYDSYDSYDSYTSYDSYSSYSDAKTDTYYGESYYRDSEYGYGYGTIDRYYGDYN